MSNNKDNFSNLLEDERIKKGLSKRFGRRPYWTFQEGLNFFLPLEYRNSFPLSVLINDYLFETLKREVETQRLETFNDMEEVKQILAYTPVADREQHKSHRIDKQKKLSPSEIREEKRRYFCSKIKIKPEKLILYIIKHIQLFSSEMEIPPKLKNLLSTSQDTPILKDNISDEPKSKSDLKTEIEQLLNDVSPELENLYDRTKHKIKNIKYITADEVCIVCKEAYRHIVESSKDDDSIKFIEIDDIDCSRVSDNTEKLPRALKGQILHNLIFRKYQNSPKTVGIRTDYQGLYDHYNKLRKET